MEQTKKTTQTDTPIGDFNWTALERYSRKTPNPDIFNKYGEIVINHESYALDYYESISTMSYFENKEPKVGDTRKIIGLTTVSEDSLVVSLTGFIDAVIDMKNEKYFCSLYNLSSSEIIDWLKTENGKTNFLENGYQVIIESVSPFIKASLSKGQTIKIKNEFFDQIKNPTAAYVGKIIEKNGGGFIINVAGVDGFLPGSLAAANIVRDFDSMIGKEIPVVVEDFLKESNTFVFSYKKYVNMVLPTKIAELDTTKKYEGTVTGVAKYGVFVEFDEIFTGLIHTSKMTPVYREKFNKGEFKPGAHVEFWIKEITSDKKIILTDEDPSIRKNEIEDFKEKNLGTIKDGEVIAIQPFGTLVKLQKDIVGLISQKEIKLKRKTFNVGDTVMVSIDRIQNDKIFLSLPSES